MNRHEIEVVVLSVLSTVLQCEVTPQTNRDNLPQWDSLRHIELIFTIEDELGVQFPEDIFPDLNSITQIVDAAATLHEA